MKTSILTILFSGNVSITMHEIEEDTFPGRIDEVLLDKTTFLDFVSKPLLGRSTIRPISTFGTKVVSFLIEPKQDVLIRTLV